MDRPPRISVVIPVKDDASFLGACLRSLAAQTMLAHEVIVVDNNSSDDSGDIARFHGATVLHEARPGIAAAAGRGYDCATGDVIARLDADSVAHRRWIEVLTDAFDSRPDVDAFTGSATFTDGPSAWRNSAARAYLGAYFVTASSALSHPPLFGSNFAMRAAAWHSVRAGVHSSDTKIHDDFDLSFHLGRAHRDRRQHPRGPKHDPGADETAAEGRLHQNINWPRIPRAARLGGGRRPR